MALALFDHVLIVVRGGGDLASGAIYRLHRAGFPVIVTELPTPLLVRRAVCYGSAVYDDSIVVEGITARLTTVSDAMDVVRDGVVPVIIDPQAEAIRHFKPDVVVDARMAKNCLDTTIDDAPLVVALGPGYVAGQNCHAIIETNRGHNLGRVIYQGTAEPDTGEPGRVANKTHSRVLRAPDDGYVVPHAQIGDDITEGQLIAEVNGLPVYAQFSGVLRGLIHHTVKVSKGMKIGDLDPRARRENCFTISDKSLAVGGGVLEAVLAASQLRLYWSSDSEHETSRSL
ncbi:MAG: EF2563 family selenium-dependent molybdenum hydroxylase system protein [Chloroflexi bacterium]|nr:MAG: EF2563 family selenium-dependent molybdenum hydroxylase system protein [Chloroflexota bacterium]